MQIVWTCAAEQARDNIIRYIAEDNIDAALALDMRIDQICELIAQFPMLGYPGRKRGTREFVIAKNYIIVYQVDQKGISIVMLLHGAQQYPPLQKSN